MESKNFNLNSTDITSTCNVTCNDIFANKLITNSNDGYNRTTLGSGSTYIKLNPLQFTPVLNDGSISISTNGVIFLNASSIIFNAPVLFGQTNVISSYINQVF